MPVVLAALVAVVALVTLLGPAVLAEPAIVVQPAELAVPAELAEPEPLPDGKTFTTSQGLRYLHWSISHIIQVEKSCGSDEEQ